MIKPEGVAAPLEPTRPIDIALVTIRDFPVCIVGEKFRDKLLERFLDMRDALIEARRAAAVSKNLQEELERAKFNLDQAAQERQQYARVISQALGDDNLVPNVVKIKRLRARMSELEKEITALRETK